MDSLYCGILLCYLHPRFHSCKLFNQHWTFIRVTFSDEVRICLKNFQYREERYHFLPYYKIVYIVYFFGHEYSFERKPKVLAAFLSLLNELNFVEFLWTAIRASINFKCFLTVREIYMISNWRFCRWPRRRVNSIAHHTRPVKLRMLKIAGILAAETKPRTVNYRFQAFFMYSEWLYNFSSLPWRQSGILVVIECLPLKPGKFGVIVFGLRYVGMTWSVDYQWTWESMSVEGRSAPDCACRYE